MRPIVQLHASSSRYSAAILLTPMLLIGLLSGCSGVTHRLQVDGETRGFRLHVPKQLPPEQAVPLVLALHAFSDTPRGMAYMTGLSEVADAEGFIVAYPQGKRRMWNSEADGGTDDVAFLDALLDKLLAEYPIDPTRIYATGASAGAMMIQFYTCQRDRLAAIAPVMGPLRDATFQDCNATTPVLGMHGVSDPVIPYAGGLTDAGPGRSMPFYGAEESAALWAELLGCGAPPTETLLRNEAGQIVARRYAYGCAPDREVLFYAVEDHGHTWPGGRNRYPRFIVGELADDFNATQTIWAFFQRHQRDGTP